MARVLAWLGGAMFVASLLYTVYFYGWVLGNPAPAKAAALGTAIGVNLILFGVFAAHHSVFAREPVKRWITRVMPARMERSFYVWIASLLLVGVCVRWQLVSGMVYRIDGAGRWGLYAFQLAGVYLSVRAVGFIDPLELAGIRQVSGIRDQGSGIRDQGSGTKAGLDTLIPDTWNLTPEFRTDGPFGLVRHPIYLGWILMTFGASAMTTNRLIFAVITTFYLILAIPWEEKSLVRAFGDRYRAYQSAVRWRLFPGVW